MRNEMVPYCELLSKHPLFEGISRDETLHLLDCAASSIQSGAKGDILIHEMSMVESPGLLLSGRAEASRLDPEGRRLLIKLLEPGGLFGEILSIGNHQKSPVTVTLTEDSRWVRLNFDWMIGRCEKACASHTRILRNLLSLVSVQYFELHERLGCLIRPSLREKILCYLQSVSAETGSRTFRIPFDRASLADYLAADRSALSRELSHMKRDGLIDYYKGSFRLLI